MQFPDTLIQQMEQTSPFRATVERIVASSAEVDEFGDPQGPDGITFIVDRATGQLMRAEFDDSFDGDDFPLFIPAGKIIEAAEDLKASSWRDLEAVVRDSWDGMLAQEYFWYAFSAEGEETEYGHGTEYEAMTYVDLLNEDEDDDIYTARRLNDSEADALGLEDHEDSFEIDEAIEDMTAEDEDEE